MIPSRFGGILADITPLRLDRDFRLLLIGQAISGAGNELTRIALPYAVYVLTGSIAAVAAISFFQLIAFVGISLLAGAVADAVDRRRLMLVANVGMAATSLAMAFATATSQPSLVAIFVLSSISSIFEAVDRPARSAAIPRIVPPERISAALTLSQLVMQASVILGPALGGILIATTGVSTAFALDALSFLGAIIAVARMTPLPSMPGADRPSLKAMADGLRYALRRRALLGAFVIDLNAVAFGAPSALYPALSLNVFGAGAAGVGLLAAAPAAGAVGAAVLSGWVARIDRAGRAVVVAVTVWGVAIIGFGLSTTLPIAMAFLALAGAADMISAVFRGTIVQLATDDTFRGRVSAIRMLAVKSGQPLANIESAAAATIVGVQPAVVLGGVLCLAGTGVIVRMIPELATFRIAAVRGLSRGRTEVPVDAQPRS